MSHEVEVINGQAQMAYVGEVPWHGLGVKVDADLSPQEIQKAAGLDWSVSKEPIFASMEGEDLIEVPGKKALIRSSDNSVLDVVGDQWIPVQNDDAFNFFDDYVKAGGMEMHTAGSLSLFVAPAIFPGPRHAAQGRLQLCHITSASSVLPSFSDPKFGAAVDSIATDDSFTVRGLASVPRTR